MSMFAFQNYVKQSNKLFKLMEQQYNFQHLTHFNQNLCKFKSKSIPIQSQCIQSHPAKIISANCNTFQPTSTSSHTFYQEPSILASTFNVQHFVPRLISIQTENSSNCLQQIKSKLQKTDEFVQQSQQADKSNLESSDLLLETNEEGHTELRGTIQQGNEDESMVDEELAKEKAFVDLSYFNEINTENVIDILQNPNFNRLKCSRNYSSRKQFVAWKLKLKDILLSKYQLFQIKKNAKPLKLTEPTQKPKRKNKKVKLGLRELLVRKLHKIIRKNQNISLQQKAALRILENMQQKHNINSLAFRKSFTQIIRQLARNPTNSENFSQNSQFFEDSSSSQLKHVRLL